MVDLIKKEHEKVAGGGEPDIHLLSSAADFFSVYADRCHHGKEEDILFEELEKRGGVPDELDEIRKKLVREHEQARQYVQNLRKAYGDYHTGGGEDAKKRIAELLEKITDLYPQHIETEDKEFFFPVMDLFSKEEQDEMLERFYEFDRQMIHEKYEQVVAELENRTG
jgi:hemerythrin-like domain-containing protein